jgi:hypothetical protein
MIRQKIFTVCGLVGAFALFCASPAAQAAKLIDPPQVEWGCELSDEEVLSGITAGLLGRGWIIRGNDSEGNLVAQVIVRGKHTLVVDIAYTNTMFNITFKNSKNLKYKIGNDGSPRIHRNANSWMNNILIDITPQLVALCKN